MSGDRLDEELRKQGWLDPEQAHQIRRRRDNAHREMQRARKALERKEEVLAAVIAERNSLSDLLKALDPEFARRVAQAAEDLAKRPAAPRITSAEFLAQSDINET